MGGFRVEARSGKGSSASSLEVMVLVGWGLVSHGRMTHALQKGMSIWASPENPMKAFLYKTTTDSLKDLPRKVAMVCAKGTLHFAKGVS